MRRCGAQLFYFSRSISQTNPCGLFSPTTVSDADSLVRGLRDLLRFRPIHQLIQCVHVRPRAADNNVFVRSGCCKAALRCPALGTKGHAVGQM